MRNEDNGFVIIILGCAIFLIAFALFSASSNKAERENNVEIFIEKNSIGCNRYRYNDSTYWRCDDSNINQIEVIKNEGRSQKIVYEPVINNK